MQLVAYGAQDVYLTGSPQITFFKVVYRRHTNFSVEPIPQQFNGAADFGRTVTINVPRSGDLITNMYVHITLNSVGAGSTQWGFVRRLGLAIVQHYKIEIGGSKIDEQYGDWLNIWYELTHKSGQKRGFAKMVGDVSELTNIDAMGSPQYQMYVPLAFWFCRNNGLALPLIALQYHDVRVTIDFRQGAQCVNTIGTGSAPSVTMQDAELVIDYVFLDSEERKRFAQASHEYLIEQLQFTGSESLPSLTNKYRLNFNHPCKYLVWAPHLEKYTSGQQYVAYATNGDWNAALTTFAKLLWLATRQISLSGGVYTLASSVVPTVGSQEQIDASPVGTWVNASVLNSLVTAEYLSTIDISGTVNAQVQLPANPSNVVILTNNLTIAHMSYAINNIFPALGLVTSGQTVPVNTLNFLASVGVNLQDQFNYGNNIDGTDNPVVSGKLTLNGSDRFQERDGVYFNYVQPYQHFSNTPADGINVYSFALKPEDHQPSGTCNFSRIDNATLNVSLGQGNVSGTSTYLNNFLGGANSNSLLNIYTVNYNVLRVMSGMAGVAYSN